MPLISVIVPVYKVEKYLDRCIDSIVKQSFRDFELILVDDGSPDRCPGMCDEWKKRDDRIEVIHQNNQGLSAARNAGIRIASGEFLAFIDSDDWVSHTMLADLYELLVKYDADISICDFIKTSKETSIRDQAAINETVYSQEEFMKVIMRISGNRCIHYAWGKLYRKSVIDIDDHYPVGMLNEDVEGMFKAALKSKKIVETTKIGYFYFENNESISRKRFGANFLSLHEVWSRILSLSESIAPQYYDYVKYNYQRSDFTILMDSILYGDRETDIMFKEDIGIIYKRLRKNISCLLQSPMLLNRKIMLIFVGYAYGPFKSTLRLLRRLRLHN